MLVMRDADESVARRMVILIASVEASEVWTPEGANAIQKAESVLVATVADPRHVASHLAFLKGAVRTLLCMEPECANQRQITRASGLTGSFARLLTNTWTCMLSMSPVGVGRRAKSP